MVTVSFVPTSFYGLTEVHCELGPVFTSNATIRWALEFATSQLDRFRWTHSAPWVDDHRGSLVHPYSGPAKPFGSRYGGGFGKGSLKRKSVLLSGPVNIGGMNVKRKSRSWPFRSHNASRTYRQPHWMLRYSKCVPLVCMPSLSRDKRQREEIWSVGWYASFP